MRPERRVAELGSLGVMEQPDSIEKAIRQLGFRRTIVHGDRRILVACLVRMSDWIPLRADWWRGKEVCVIGADLDGNFFLRHCDGTVRLWEQQLQRDSVLAPSVRDFVRMIED